MSSKQAQQNRVTASGYSQPPTATVGAVYPWGAASGPWYIETQRMDITYVRVPNYALASETLGLSSVATTHNVLDTHLLCKVETYKSAASSVANFGTSSYSQNQKFLVNNVSTDSYGANYGALDASNLGCAGQIYTASTYVYRVQLSSMNPQPVGPDLGVSTGMGTNYVLAGGDNTIGMVDASSDQTAEVYDFKRSNRANAPGSFLPGPTTNGQGTGSVQPMQLLDTLNFLDQPIYTMIGTYSPTLETFFQITQAIDLCGSKMAAESLAGTPPFTGPGNGPYATQWLGFNQGMSNYDISKHDFT